MTQDAVIAHVRDQIRRHGSQRAYAAHVGISQQYLCDVLNGRRDISAELAALLGFERLVVYVKAPRKTGTR